MLYIIKKQKQYPDIEDWMEKYSSEELVKQAKSDRVYFQKTPTRYKGSEADNVARAKWKVGAKWMAVVISWALPHVTEFTFNKTVGKRHVNLEDVLYSMSHHTEFDTNFGYLEKHFFRFSQYIPDYVSYHLDGTYKSKPRSPIPIALSEFKRALSGRIQGTPDDYNKEDLIGDVNYQISSRQERDIELEAFWKKHRSK